jgi:pimeloyl-ACP methyl ester carboxylesterase
MLTAFQRRFLYFPDRLLVGGPRDRGFAHEEVELRTEDAVRLHAWWLPTPGAARTALFLHGNAGNVSYWLEAAAAFRDAGWSTLLLDYRGYGRSEGEPTEQGTYLDARAAWMHLVHERGVDPFSIVAVGRSLGGGVATWLARHHPLAGLVLEATFTSIADVVAHAAPLPGIRRFVRLGYPSLSRMPQLDVPLLVVHGRGDDLVPFAHGRALFDAAAGPKRFVELAGGHNDAFTESRAAYVAALQEFERDLGAR